MPVSSTTSSACSLAPRSTARPPCGGPLAAGSRDSFDPWPQPATTRLSARTRTLERIATCRRVDDHAGPADRPAVIVVGEPDIAQALIGELRARRKILRDPR